jgi:hypothetical protein
MLKEVNLERLVKACNPLLNKTSINGPIGYLLLLDLNGLFYTTQHIVSRNKLGSFFVPM